MTLPVSIKGIVMHGNHLGNTIDMPTANISLPDQYKTLERGVYYSKVTVGKTVYKGITNVGIKPTVQDTGNLNAETFLYDFEGDLYDKEITVDLLKFRRPERKFSSFEELSMEMHRDLEAGRTFTDNQ